MKVINHVLFLDDDVDVLKSFEHAFKDKIWKESINFQKRYFELVPHSRQDISEAFNLVKDCLAIKKPIKVAFIDLKMPTMNGLEVANKFLEIDPYLEIVLVTSTQDMNLTQYMSEIESSSKMIILKKPFSPLELRQLASNLSQKYDLDVAREELLTNVSHELKTPLSSIMGFTKILMEGAQDSEEKDNLKIIWKNSKLMHGLIDDLISTLQIEKNQYKLNLNEINIKEFLNNIYQNSLSMLDQKREKINLKLDINTTHQTFYADEIRVKQCILNLINNSIKFTTSGEITILVRDSSSGVTFSVKDTGIGIDDLNMNDIFSKFTRLENETHELPGLGLGLSLCKSIVEKHNGTIQVESKKGLGSQFSLYLPQDHTSEDYYTIKSA